MKLTPIGSNQTVLMLNDGTRVLFSYQTPVAYERMGRFYRSATRHSVTTSKHVNQWAGKDATEVPQADIDAIVGRG